MSPSPQVDRDGAVYAIQQLDREDQSEYRLIIEVKDGGVTPKVTQGMVKVVVKDINDNAPIFVYPTESNNSMTIMWSTSPGTTITKVKATDADDGHNGKVAYFISSGDESKLFSILSTGEIKLNRGITANDKEIFNLIIVAHDLSEQRQLETAARFEIAIDVTNATFSAVSNNAKEDEKLIIIAGVVGGFTLIFAIVVIKLQIFTT